jgi:alpha-1,6-mannosyltransferase
VSAPALARPARRSAPANPDTGHGAALERDRRRVLLATLGVIALAGILVATIGIVLTAASAPSILVPRSGIVFPAWVAGPLHHLLAHPIRGPQTLARSLSITLAAMFVAYAVVVVAARSLSMWVIVAVVVALHVVLLLGPPLQLNDVFNYLGYARLGALHGLNPYTHTISAELFDPIYRFASWDGLRSPYGELFTILSYPLAFLPLSVAFWVLKAVAVLLSLAFLGLVWLCARRLGRDPRQVITFVALNPIYLIYAVGGFHNDFLMLVPSTAAILFVLKGRDRSAGASLMVAIAVKFTAVALGPFLLLALASRRRIRRFIIGGVIALVPLLAVSLALFGTAPPNIGQQSRLVSIFSVPNLVGLPFGVGGSSLVLHLATLAVALVALYHLLLRRDDWLAGAGWTMFALILSLSWTVPWYVVWLLPLAALSRRPSLRGAALALTVFMLVTFAPVTTNYVSQHRIGLLSTPAGRAARSLERHLVN